MNLKSIWICNKPDVHARYFFECESIVDGHEQLEAERFGISCQEQDAIIELMSGTVDISFELKDEHVYRWEGPFFDEFGRGERLKVWESDQTVTTWL